MTDGIAATAVHPSPVEQPKLDIVPMRDLGRLAVRWFGLGVALTLVGAASGASYHSLQGEYFETSVSLALDQRDGLRHIEDPARINEAMVRVFSSVELANAFAMRFITGVGQNDSKVSTAASLTVLKQFLQGAGGVDVQSPLSLRAWISAYVNTAMVETIQSNRVPKQGFYFALSAQPGPRLDLKFRSRASGIAPRIVHAIKLAFNESARRFNMSTAAVMKGQLEHQRSEFASSVRDISEAHFSERTKIERDLALVGVKLDALEPDVAAMEKAAGLSQSGKASLEFAQNNLGGLMMMRTLLDIPGKAGGDVLAGMRELRFRSLSERISRLQATQSSERFRNELERLQAALSGAEEEANRGSSKLRVSQATLESLQIALAKATEEAAKPLDGSTYSVPLISLDFTNQNEYPSPGRYFDRPGPSARTFAVIGGILGLLASVILAALFEVTVTPRIRRGVGVSRA